MKDELTQQDMDDLLIGLIDTKYWNAIERFNRVKTLAVDYSLRSLDPNTQATIIARNQGSLVGLTCLEQYIKSLKEKRDKREDEGKA